MAELKTSNIETFDLNAEDYDRWFDEHPMLYQAELLALKQAVPIPKKGIEIGVGTGRFAHPLGVGFGVEPSERMAYKATERGIKVIRAEAENLPFGNSEFDFALLVTTVCFLENISLAFSECSRILKPKGEIIIGLIDKNSELGKRYEREKSDNKFFKNAHFHSTEEITALLENAGLTNFSYWQTLTKNTENEIELPQQGFGDGSFVVIKALKQELPIYDESKIALLSNKAYSEPSVFQPENLLREARRQKSIPNCGIPTICVLDPDGDLVDYLLRTGQAKPNECWACYHTKLYSFVLGNTRIGIIPCAVGAPFAVLIAEQLFVSGCQLLVSVTSAGIICPPETNKRFALLTECIRDDGASYHYLPPGISARLAGSLFQKLSQPVLTADCPWFAAKSWTTDAPYRETLPAIAAMEAQGVTCVEMEAAALYAFAQAKNKSVVCFAHLTNTMAQTEGDFEKGESSGSIDTLNLLSTVTKLLK